MFTVIAEEITQILQAETREKLASLACAAARKAVGAEAAAFVIRSGEDECEYLEVDSILPLWKEHKVPLSDSFAGWCIANEEPVVHVQNVAEDDRATGKRFNGTFVKSLAAVPVRQTEVDAAISIYWAEPRTLTEAETREIQTLADTVSVALRNIELKEKLDRLVADRTAALQAVNDELESFAFTVAHDLKNPLGVIKTNSWTLLNMFDQQLPEKTEACANRIDTAADRMQKQIDGMLSLFRVSQNEIEFEEVDLSTIAHETCADLKELQKGDGPERKISIEENLKVYGDSAMLRVVLENLFDNAWKFTAKTASPLIEIGMMQGGIEGVENVYFVRDNGVGFESAEADSLFEVFKRFHPKEQFSGTGIGLTSVRRIVNKHGGRVWAESKIGEGATLFFVLPDLPISVKPSETFS